jgi:hypothetical protein
MKHTLFALLLVLLTVTFSFARWALIPLDKLIEDSDLIVIGTLNNVKEHSEKDVDYGKGTIIVDEILWQNKEIGTKLKLTWENPTGIACPRVDHKDSQGKKAIWLLKVEQNNIVKADYPGRFVELDQKEEVLKLIKQTKEALSKN